MGDSEEQFEDPEVQAWLAGTMKETIPSDLFDAFNDGTLFCRLMLAIQPTLSFGYHKNPEDEQQVFENMAVFFDRCDELEVPIYFTYDDIVNRTNLQHVLSTVCTFGEFALKSASREERKGSLSLSSSSGPQTVSTSSSYPSPRDNNNNSNEMEKDEGVEPVVVLQKEETPEEKREKQKRKQTMVLAELFETEKSFVADLELLVHKYFTPALSASVLTNDEAQDIFINIRDVWVANRKLLKDLDNRRRGAPLTQYVPIADIFVQKAQQLLVEPYSVYCCSHNLSLDYVEKLKKEKKKFAEFIYNVQMNDPQVRGLDLISFLVKPVQRICKYPLLFRELLKQAPEGEPDNEELREACITLEKVVEKVNANKRVSESQAKIAELEKSLHLGQEEFTLVAPGRTFVRKGEFKKPLSDPSAKQSPVYAFLLSDLLLLAKNANDVYGKNEYLVYTNIMSMDQITLKDLPDNQLLKNAFELTKTAAVGTRKYFLIAPTPQEKTAWVKDLTAAIEQAVKNKDIPKPTTGTSFDLTDTDQLRLFDIRTKIVGTESFNLLKLGRKPVKDGEVNMTDKGVIAARQLSLFTDVLVISRFQDDKDGKRKKKVVFKTAFPLESLILTDVRDGPEARNVFHLIHKDKKKIHIVSVSSPQDKRFWINKINENNIYKFCKNLEEEQFELKGEQAVRKDFLSVKTHERSKGSLIRKVAEQTRGASSFGSASGSYGAPLVTAKQIDGMKLRHSSVETSSGGSVKESKKKDRPSLAGVFGIGSDKKDKKDKKKSSHSSYVPRGAPSAASAAAALSPGVASLRKAPARPVSTEGNRVRPTPKAARPLSEKPDDETSSNVPTISVAAPDTSQPKSPALAKLRPTPAKAAPLPSSNSSPSPTSSSPTPSFGAPLRPTPSKTPPAQRVELDSTPNGVITPPTPKQPAMGGPRPLPRGGPGGAPPGSPGPRGPGGPGPAPRGPSNGPGGSRGAAPGSAPFRGGLGSGGTPGPLVSGLGGPGGASPGGTRPLPPVDSPGTGTGRPLPGPGGPVARGGPGPARGPAGTPGTGRPLPPPRGG